MKAFIIIFLLILRFVSFSQTDNGKGQIGVVGCLEYVKQNSNSFGISAGPALRFKRLTHVGILGGINLLYTNKSSYISPVIFADYFYDPKKAPLGPLCRFGYTSHAIYGQKDRYLFGDIGIRTFIFSIMVGYNFNLDKKNISDISPYRITLRLP